MVAVLGAAASFAIFAPAHIWQRDRLYSLSFLALVAIGAGALACLASAQQLSVAIRRQLGGPILVAVLRIGVSVNLVGWNFWIDNSTIVSMTIESLLSSVAIAYRIHLLSRDRDTARIEEAAARLLADTDPLTGLLNRRAFLREAIGRTGDHTLLIADLDHFKRVTTRSATMAAMRCCASSQGPSNRPRRRVHWSPGSAARNLPFSPQPMPDWTPRPCSTACVQSACRLI